MKLVFLDRDGVINRFPGKGFYVTREEDFVFLPRAKEALRELTVAGCEIHVISNQGCVSRGLIAQEVLDRMTADMLAEVRKHGGNIQKVHYCVHQKTDHCECKKPKLKLFFEAISGRALDMKQVYFVGDSVEDMEAGKNLGCRTALVLSGRTEESDLRDFPVKPEVIKKDLWEASEWILQKKS